MGSLDKFIHCDSVKGKWMMEMLGDLFLPSGVPRFGYKCTANCKASEEHACVTLIHWHRPISSVCMTNFRRESGCVWHFYHGWPDLPLRDKPEIHLENLSPAWKLWMRRELSSSCVPTHHGLHFRKNRLPPKGSSQLSPPSHWYCHSWVAQSTSCQPVPI